MSCVLSMMAHQLKGIYSPIPVRSCRVDMPYPFPPFGWKRLNVFFHKQLRRFMKITHSPLRCSALEGGAIWWFHSRQFHEREEVTKTAPTYWGVLTLWWNELCLVYASLRGEGFLPPSPRGAFVPRVIWRASYVSCEAFVRWWNFRDPPLAQFLFLHNTRSRRRGHLEQSSGGHSMLCVVRSMQDVRIASF